MHILTAATLEFEHDDQFKVLAALEARRVRKDSNEVIISRGYRRFRELVDHTLLEMQAEGMIRPGLNLDAVRAAVLGFADGLWRDQIVASRAGISSNYGFDDMVKVLDLSVRGLPETAAATRQSQLVKVLHSVFRHPASRRVFL